MQIEQCELSKIKPYENNPRINRDAIGKVAASIKAFGFRQPIVVDKEFVIIAGHSRYLAASKLKLKTVPIHIAAELTTDEAAEYRLADNRAGEYAEWDRKKLADELTLLDSKGRNLLATGFQQKEIKSLLALTQGEFDNSCAGVSLRHSTKQVSKTGDVWQLGEHRVVCGDACDQEVMRALMQGEKAHCVFTDPPYNVNYQGGMRKKRMPYANDKLTTDAFTQFLSRAFAVIKQGILPNAALYVCHSNSSQRQFEDALTSNGFAIRSHLVWVKNHHTLNYSRYKPKHEPIFYAQQENETPAWNCEHYTERHEYISYAHVEGQTDPWYGGHNQSSVWLAAKPVNNALHPTMKPVELIQTALNNSTELGDIVLDSFGGSGSTLIAAERLSRKARLIELDPHYVDVIVERWQFQTGKAAIHAALGLAFAALQEQKEKEGIHG